MGLTMGVDEYRTLPAVARKEFDAWLEETTGCTMVELRATSVTLIDEGGLISVERTDHPIRTNGGEAVTRAELFHTAGPPPHFIARR